MQRGRRVNVNPEGVKGKGWNYGSGIHLEDLRESIKYLPIAVFDSWRSEYGK
jgi:hypothetical protein